MSAEKPKEWWEEVFDQRYLDTYVDTFPEKRTQREVDFISRHIEITNKTSLLDVGCGHGRHAIALAKLGCHVTGIDTSQYFLDKVLKRAAEEKVNVRVFREDMRELLANGVYDVAVSLFTAFGYFEKESDHVLAIRKIVQALHQKGQFLIDVKNPISLIKGMIEKGAYDKETGLFSFHTEEKLSNGIELRVEEKYDAARMRWHAHTQWEKAGKLEEIAYSVRLFTCPELCSLLEQSGMKIQNTWGDFDESPYTALSKRLIVLAQKK